MTRFGTTFLLNYRVSLSSNVNMTSETPEILECGQTPLNLVWSICFERFAFITEQIKNEPS